MMDEAVEVQPEVTEAASEEPKKDRRPLSKFSVIAAIFGFLLPLILIYGLGAMAGYESIFKICILLLVLCLPVGLVTGVIGIWQLRRHHIGGLVLSLLGIISSLYWGWMMVLLFQAMRTLSEMD